MLGLRAEIRRPKCDVHGLGGVIPTGAGVQAEGGIWRGAYRLFGTEKSVLSRITLPRKIRRVAGENATLQQDAP